MAKMDERLEKMVERYREINDLMYCVQAKEIEKEWFEYWMQSHELE